MAERKDYRKTFKNAYGEYPKNCIVHHIDHNRNNNNITNLVAIDKRLHADYHNRYDRLSDIGVIPYDITKNKLLLSMGDGLEMLHNYTNDLKKIMYTYMNQQQIIRINGGSK